MTKTFLFVILLSVFFSGDLFSQNLNNRTSFTLKNGFEAKSLQDDSAEVSNGKYKVQKVNLGGLFIAPNLGIAYPLGTFASNSGVDLSGAQNLNLHSVNCIRLYPDLFLNLILIRALQAL